MSKLVIHDVPFLVAAVEHSQQNVRTTFQAELTAFLSAYLLTDETSLAEKIQVAAQHIASHLLPKVQREKGLEYLLLQWRTRWLCEERSGEERELHVMPDRIGPCHPHSFYWSELNGQGSRAGLVGGIVYHLDNEAWSVHT